MPALSAFRASTKTLMLHRYISDSQIGSTASLQAMVGSKRGGKWKTVRLVDGTLAKRVLAGIYNVKSKSQILNTYVFQRIKYTIDNIWIHNFYFTI